MADIFRAKKGGMIRSGEGAGIAAGWPRIWVTVWLGVTVFMIPFPLFIVEEACFWLNAPRK